jgi:hypothetical protein
LLRVELVNLFGKHGYGFDATMMYDLRLSHRLHRADSDLVFELCLTAEAAGTKGQENKCSWNLEVTKKKANNSLSQFRNEPKERKATDCWT